MKESVFSQYIRYCLSNGISIELQPQAYFGSDAIKIRLCNNKLGRTYTHIFYDIEEFEFRIEELSYTMMTELLVSEFKLDQ